MRHTGLMLILATILALLVAAPGLADELNVFDIVVQDGQIISGAYQIEVGSRLTATAEKGGKWLDATVAWSCSDSSVAFVDGGVVIAQAAGECDVTATATIEATGENTSAFIKVRVVEPAPAQTIVIVHSSGGATAVEKGETLQLLVDVVPAGVGVTWSSSRPKIISVDDDGLLTGLKKGKSIITATANDSSGASDSITISVEVPPKSISLNRKRAELYVGGVTSKLKSTGTLKAFIKPDAADKSVTWKSSHPDIVKVGKKGKVTALKKGTATITATTVNGLKAKCTVHVSKLPTIVWLPALKKVYTGKKLDLGALLRINGDITNVTWKTSDRNIAMVNAKGVVTGWAPGQCKITVRAVNGMKDVCVVNVYASKGASDEELKDDPGVNDGRPTDEELERD